MIPLRIPHALLVLFAVSGTLALLDAAFANLGLTRSTSATVAGLCTGAMVFILAYEGGRVLLFCGKGLVDDLPRRTQVRAALLAIGVLEERRSGDRRARGRDANDVGRRQDVDPTKPLMYVTVVKSSRFIAITVREGGSHRAFISTRMVDSMSQSALRGVLAHEYGHVLNGHPFNLACVLGLVASVKLTIGIPLVTAIMVLLTYLYMLRQWEYGADARAVRLTGVADVRAAFAEYLEISKEPNMGWWAECLSAHPSVHRRLAAIDRQEIASAHDIGGRGV